MRQALPRAGPNRPIAILIQCGYDVPPVVRVAGIIRPDRHASAVEGLQPAIAPARETTAAAIPNIAGAVLKHRFDHISCRAASVSMRGDHRLGGPEETFFGGSQPKRSFPIFESPKHKGRGETIQRSRFTILPKTGVAVVSAPPQVALDVLIGHGALARHAGKRGQAAPVQAVVCSRVVLELVPQALFRILHNGLDAEIRAVSGPRRQWKFGPVPTGKALPSVLADAP